MKLFSTLLLACCLLKQASSLKCHHCEKEECDSEDLVQLDCPQPNGYACFSGSVDEISTKSCFDKDHCGETGARFAKNVTVEDVGVVLVEGTCCESNLCNWQKIDKNHCGETGARFAKNVTVEDVGVVLVEGTCCESNLCNWQKIDKNVAMKLKGGKEVLKNLFCFTGFLLLNFYA